MEQMELKPYVKDNQLSLSLLRFHVKINILSNSRCIYHQLTITDSERNTLTFNFYTLEDAIGFIQNIVNKSKDFNEIIHKYEEEYEHNNFKGPKVEPREDQEKGIVTLSPEEVDEAIIGYFGEGKEYRVSVKEELSVDFKGNPKIIFYLIEHLEYNGIKKDYSTILTESDLKKAFEYYLKDLDYDIINFKYIGGVHRTGYYVDEDKPHYEGIEIHIQRKEKPYRLKKENKK